MKDKHLIIILLVVIAILAAAVCLTFFSNNLKEDAYVDIMVNDTICRGDSLNVQLMDVNKTPIVDKKVNITFTNGNETYNYFSVTNKYGIATMKIDLDPGNYTVKVDYNGDEIYASNSSIKEITVLEEVKQAEASTAANDPGAFYSPQAGRVIYTGEVQFAPDYHHWKHLGNNEWVKID